MKKLSFLFGFCFFIPSMAFAGSCGTNTCNAKISTLYPHGGNGKINIELDADMSPLNCTLSEGKFVVLKEGNLRHQEIYSMLLSAAISERELHFRIAEQTPDCELIYTQLRL